MILHAVALAATFAATSPPPPEPFFGEDKVKHFVASFVVSSLAVSTARVAGLDQSESLVVGTSLGFASGIFKEVHDARSGRFFSVRDLLWDIAGLGSAVVLFDQAR